MLMKIDFNYLGSVRAWVCLIQNGTIETLHATL